jgi:hypothetical protein
MAGKTGESLWFNTGQASPDRCTEYVRPQDTGDCQTPACKSASTFVHAACAVAGVICIRKTAKLNAFRNSSRCSSVNGNGAGQGMAWWNRRAVGVFASAM